MQVPGQAVRPQDIVEHMTTHFAGVIAKPSWGETAFFYNPNHTLPHGVYFSTIKEKDGDNDKASRLNRPGVFRLSLGIGPEAYAHRFGPRPARPAKGQAVITGHDYTVLDVVLPHPVYAWMGWACVLCPSQATLDSLDAEIATAYELAVGKFNKRVRSSGSPRYG